ncbi:MAG: hypothetical protein R3F59_30235 [Myxococcota bacterium]
MTKREEQELADATRRVVARWSAMTDADRTERLKAAGILDEAGELSPRYRAPSADGKARANSASS